MSDEIKFQAEMKKVQTMADGGIRFVFDTGERYIKEAAMLMECKRHGLFLEITVKESKNITSAQVSVKQDVTDGQMEAGNQRKSEWSPDQE